jgi:ATP-binding cassette, subfamily C (CFTR/MRP), member 1
VALARAVYTRKDVILLDDTFSGLDADTEDRIFTRLFSRQGLFRKLGSTALLVTHAVHRLSYADHIIAMAADGSIAEQGSLEQLQASGGYVSMLETRYKAEKTEENVQRTDDIPSGLTKAKKEDQIAQEEGTELDIAQQDLTRHGGDLSLYSYYLSSVHWASTVLWVSCFVMYGVAGKLGAFVVNYWTDASSTHGNSVNGFYLGMYGMLTALATGGLMGGVYHYILYFSPKSARVLHERLLRSVMNAPLAFFTSVDIGTTTNR